MTTYGATYGKFLYGSELYGSTANLTGTYNWIVEVDWDGDGVFDGSNESGRLTDIDCYRGRKNFLQADGQGFFPISVGTCRLTLDNHDGRYDAWNTSSPLYPNVIYGRDVRVRVVDIETNTTYPFFYGVISDIQPSGYGANRIIKLVIEDGLRYLRSVDGLAPFAIGDDSNGVITSILNQVSWAYPKNIDDDNTEIINYFWSSVGTRAADTVNDIASSFLSQFFVTADGTARYLARSSTQSTSYLYDESILLKDIGLPQPWVNQRDKITASFVNAKEKNTGSSTLLFNFVGEPIKIPASYNSVFNPFVITMEMNYNDPNLLSGNASGTITITTNTAADGSGSDESTNTTVISPNIYGKKMKFEIYQTSGVDIYLTNLLVYGNPILGTISNMTYPEVVTSETRNFGINMKWEQDAAKVRTFVNLLGAFLSVQQKTPIVKMVNRPAYQFPELFDKVNLDIPSLGINTLDFRVGGIEHVGTPQEIMTTLYLEPFIST